MEKEFTKSSMLVLVGSLCSLIHRLKSWMAEGLKGWRTGGLEGWMADGLEGWMAEGLQS